MAIVIYSRTANLLKLSSLNSAVTSCVQSCQMSWGNVNTKQPRGRHRPNKHWPPQHIGLRRAKQQIIELPNVEEHRKADALRDSGDPSKIKEIMKREGRYNATPNRPEKPIYLASSSGIFDPFVPSEADSSSWTDSKKSMQQKLFAKTYRAVRNIRKYEKEFDPSNPNFIEELKEIYINSHRYLAGKKHDDLHDVVTEFAYGSMTHNTENVSMYWDLIEFLEPPKILNVRVADLLMDSNLFAQMSVRMLSKQIFASYDRFGRLIHGHPHVAKDVLEIVVFEKHFANIYGKWRLHSKLMPEWLAKSRAPGTLTHIYDKEEVEDLQKYVSQQESKVTDTEKDEQDAPAIYDRKGQVFRSKSSK